MSLPFEALERVYDPIAAATDYVEAERESLLPADRLGDYESAADAVAAPERDLS